MKRTKQMARISAPRAGAGPPRQALRKSAPATGGVKKPYRPDPAASKAELAKIEADAQAAVARLTESKKEEAAARLALSAAEEALERVLEQRRALERVACADCVKLRELGTDSPACARLRFETCTDCREPYCDACFGAMTTCDRCGDRNRCRDCCRGRHGDAGDESCEEDSLCEAY